MLPDDRPLDLDELYAACRSESAKRTFGEAMRSYRAGAYRACIVTTWIAVVYDYIWKLEELSLSGSPAAKKKLDEFEAARGKKGTEGIKALQMLENCALKSAVEDFELLSPRECRDLERLQQDRHSCAHPSFLAPGQMFQPSAELARVHMRNAVMHLLSRPPVQGKEGEERIRHIVSSAHFPKDKDAAKEPLSPDITRAKGTLVTALAIGWTKELLASQIPLRRQTIAALLALFELRHHEVDPTLAKALPVLAERVPDELLDSLLSYCVWVGTSWEKLGVASQSRLKTYVATTTSPRTIRYGLCLPDTAARASARISTLIDADLIKLLRSVTGKAIARDVQREYVRRLSSSTKWSQMRDLREALRDPDMGAGFTSDDCCILLDALATNKEMHKYDGFAGMVHEMLRAPKAIADDPRVIDKWKSIQLLKLEAMTEAVHSAICERLPALLPTKPKPTTPEPSLV